MASRKGAVRRAAGLAQWGAGVKEGGAKGRGGGGSWGEPVVREAIEGARRAEEDRSASAGTRWLHTNTEVGRAPPGPPHMYKDRLGPNGTC